MSFEVKEQLDESPAGKVAAPTDDGRAESVDASADGVLDELNENHQLFGPVFGKHADKPVSGSFYDCVCCAGH